MKANNSKIVKTANKTLVCDTIKLFECITIEEILNHTGLSRPTVLNLLKELTEQGLVIKSGFAQSDVGRQPTLYSINATGYFAIGIDVDAPPIHLVVSNLNGEPVYYKNWDIDQNETVSEIIDKIIMNIEKAINEANIDKAKVLGIGIGLPAVVDIKKNKTVRISRIKGWIDIDIAEIIKRRTGIDVYVRNDAHLIGIAEHSVQKKYDNMLYFIHRAGAGIGMAIIIKGKLYEGLMGNSAYIGHSIIMPNGRQCDCGNKGCLETYCSKRSIVNEYYLRKNRKLSYQELIKLSDQGDLEAIDIFRQAGYYFGIGLSNAIKIFDIHVIVLGNLECNEDHVFFKSIYESLQQNMLGFSNISPKLISGQLKEEGFALGGCHFVLQLLFRAPTLNIKA